MEVVPAALQRPAAARQTGESPQRLLADPGEQVAQADPDAAAPGGLAGFVKASGEKGRMRVGDEFVVRMAGPWDGPVRVSNVSDHSFRLITLERHLEAGQIEGLAIRELHQQVDHRRHQYGVADAFTGNHLAEARCAERWGRVRSQLNQGSRIDPAFPARRTYGLLRALLGERYTIATIAHRR